MGALKLKDGTKVPGATVIVGQLDKPYLVNWANKIGKQGIDVNEYVSSTAKTGTIIHMILESHTAHKEIDLNAYEQKDIELAEQIFFNNYMPFENQHIIEPIFNEESFVSEEYKFGGIIDFYCKFDGKYTIVDFKTSKSISNEHILQVSSYVQLLKENGYEVEQIMILDVKKELESKLEHKIIDVKDLDNYWNLFKCLIDVYYAKKLLNWN